MTENTEQKYAHKIPHYYGDVVRRLFMFAGIIILVALPVFENFLPIPTLFSIFIIILLIVFAAMTNPLLRIVNRINVGSGIAGLALFEYFAVMSFRAGDLDLAAVHQVLAFVFFFALYLSMKTFRAMVTGQIDASAVAKTAQLPLNEEEDNESLMKRLLKDDPGRF